MANPLRHFKCNETSGTTLIDSSDNTTDGTVANASIWNASGKIGRGLYLNELYSGQTSLGGALTTWTFACWFKLDAITANDRFFQKNTDENKTFFIITNSTTIDFMNESSVFKSFTVPTLSTGTWYHVILSCTNGGDVNLYLNNVESSTGTLTGGSTMPDQPIKIGSHFNGTSNVLDGYMDDIRFYNIIINTAERARIYNSGTGTETTNTPPPAVAPTVTTQAVSDIGTTTATGNGNITDTGGENNDKRGIVYGTSSQGDPGDVAPGSSGYDAFEEQAGSFGTGAFTRSLTGLNSATKYYARAYAHNSAGYSYGGEVDFILLTIFHTSGEKELRRNWPVEEGLTARTQKQEGRQTNLVPEEESLVPKRLKVGL